MTIYAKIHIENPQSRLVKQAVEIIHGGGVVVYPTDSLCAIGCHMGDKAAMDRIRQLKNADKQHNFTLICRDLSDIATYAKVDNWAYRLLKSLTPGPYTFILKATREVPKRLQHPKRKTIGLRVPAHPVSQLLLETLGEPLMSCTLTLPDSELFLTDEDDLRDLLSNRVDMIMDGGYCGHEPSTVIDLTEGYPQVIRAGKGDVSSLDY
jgi:tRNA threonylcarbamoyl adenosine modification protein (Sua5/YciO/YrdC/YwlC family)